MAGITRKARPGHGRHCRLFPSCARGGTMVARRQNGGRLRMGSVIVGRLLAAALALLLPGAAWAQQEVPGARDFPLIKRYEGSKLVGYDARAFDGFKLVTGKLKIGDNGMAAYDQAKPVEGRHTRLLYLAPPQRSPLEIFRNYQQDLSDKGF